MPPYPRRFGRGGGGTVRVALRLGTRHYCTALPLNERISHRINLEWLVISSQTGRLITVLSQSDHNYHHLEFFVSLPSDRFITLVPGSPYLCDAAPILDVIIEPYSHEPQVYRYEVEIGASSDSALIGDGWSYREGHLPFMHWFHNKAFRWGFDGAQLSLPVVVGQSIHINLNALCRTVVEVWMDDIHLTTLMPISDSQRWHDEKYQFDISGELITSNIVSLQFRFAHDAMNMIDFNLRQSTFAVSRIVVDIFGAVDEDLFDRIAAIAWSEKHSSGCLSLAASLSDQSMHENLGQAAILVADVEFELLSTYFAPHSSLWNTVRGLKASAERSGISVNLLSSKRMPTGEVFEAVVLGPIRFDIGEIEWLGAGVRTYDGALLTGTIPTLSLFGTPLDDTILGAFSYREIYDVPLSGGVSGNFWEFLPTGQIVWEASLTTAFDATVIGKRPGSNVTWLSTASAEDWWEMGDPGAERILELFWNQIAATNFVTTAFESCSLRLLGKSVALSVPDSRTAMRSYGGGIARGWAVMDFDFAMFAPQNSMLEVHVDRLPRKGVLAAALLKIVDQLQDLDISVGSVRLVPVSEQVST